MVKVGDKYFQRGNRTYIYIVDEISVLHRPDSVRLRHDSFTRQSLVYVKISDLMDHELWIKIGEAL